jgi:hypothetical protein
MENVVANALNRLDAANDGATGVALEAVVVVVLMIRILGCC